MWSVYKNRVLTGVFAALAFSAAAAQADLYGAIAYSTAEGVYGYASNYNSQAEAEDAALNFCVENLQYDDSVCTVELWFKNGYGALALSSDRSFGTGHGQYKQDAQLMALENCQQYADDCDIEITVGTD